MRDTPGSANLGQRETSASPPRGRASGLTRVALLGLGTVGRGVLTRLAGPTGLAASARLRVTAVVVSRPDWPDHAQFLANLASTTPGGLPMAPVGLERMTALLPSVDLIIDVTGGGADVRELLVRALRAGVDVVTANKSLLSRFGREVFAAASGPGAGRLAFEAAVGGGIPIVRTLRHYLAHDRIRLVAGILNGTSNFILGRVAGRQSFSEALSDAIARGYAEPGGGSDVSGEDALHKIVLLSRLAFGAALSPEGPVSQCVRGIVGIDSLDFRYATDRLGRDIRSLAIAELDADTGRMGVRVGPVLIPRHSIFCDVRGCYNGIVLDGRDAGTQFLCGPGAGQAPTAHAVLSDVLALLRCTPAEPPSVEGTARLGWPVPDRALLAGGPGELTMLDQYEYDLCYVRFVVRNRPGIVGTIAEAFGRNGVHIHEVLQLEHSREELRALAGSQDTALRYAIDAGEALAFAVTLNRCPFGAIRSVAEGLSRSAAFRNLCPPLVLPCEDRVPEPASRAGS